MPLDGSTTSNMSSAQCWLPCMLRNTSVRSARMEGHLPRRSLRNHRLPDWNISTESWITVDIDAAVLHARQATGFDTADRIVGLAGSVTTVAALAMGLPEYDSARIHASRISAAQVHQVTLLMLAATRAERAAEPVMHPGRVDVIGGGALVLDRILTLGGFDEVIVSEHDILDGIALNLAQGRPVGF